MTAPASATPILDRLRPLPAPAPRRSGMMVVYVVWGTILAAAAVGAISGHPPALRRFLLHDAAEWAQARGVGLAAAQVVLALMLITLVMLVIHEGGHVLGGLLAGFRFQSLRTGPLLALRAALISDAGVFQARRRGRPDLAEQWLAEVPAAVAPDPRLRIEAAILEARGDTAGALAKLDEYDGQVDALPLAWQREYVRRLVQRWRAELTI